MNSSLRSIFLLVTLIFAGGEALAQTTWTLRNQNNASNSILWSIAEGNAGVVAVGDGGRIVHSSDGGRTWVTRTSGTAVWLVAVTFGNGRYVAVGDNGTILTSNNATAWTRSTVSGTTARLNNVVYAQGKFVAVGEGGTIVASTDATTWNPAISGVTGFWLRGLAFANGYWLATGQGGNVTISTDGVTWTKQSSSTTDDLEAAVFAEDLSSTPVNSNGYVHSYFLAVGANSTTQVFLFDNHFDAAGRTFFFAFNAYNFPARPNSTVRLRSLSVANKVFVASGENGSIFVAKSEFGPWTQASINTNKNLVGAGVAFGSLVLVGDNETIFQSEQIFTSRLGNISTRGVAASGGAAMIAGTAIQGTKPKQLLLRGIGPALAGFGVSGALADPTLGVFDSTGRMIASNAGWGTNLNAAAIATAAANAGAFALAADSKDAALLLTLNPGNYTFQVNSASSGSGNVLVEAYDLDAIDATSPRAINISTRGQVGTGDNILIAGLVVQGQSSRTLLIRGVGPTLGQFGVAGTLADPVVKVIGGDGTTLATNDNWADVTVTNGRRISADDVVIATAASGAFALAENSKDAALIITLVPGNYTIQVSGANNTTGVALVEAYDIPSN